MIGRGIYYHWTEEVINVCAMLEFACMPEASTLKVGTQSYREIIRIFVRRAREIDSKGLGKIWSAWWEPPMLGALMNRRYSGLKSPAARWLPPEEKAAPNGFSCLSPFALPRLLRQVMRCGTDLVDLDLKMSAVQCQLRRHVSSGVTLDKTKELYADRENKCEEARTSPFGQDKSGDDVQMLFLAIVYGGVAPGNTGQFVKDFETEQAHIRKYDAEQNPKLLEELAKRGKDDASLQTYLNFDEERRCVNLMETAAKHANKKVRAYEHDGVIGLGLADVKVEGLDTKVKPIPGSMPKLLQLAKEEDRKSVK